MSQDSSALREEGNSYFKTGDVENALSCYTKALKISDGQSDSGVLYRNRAACYLKLEDFNKAEADATKGNKLLHVHPHEYSLFMYTVNIHLCNPMIGYVGYK